MFCGPTSHLPVVWEGRGGAGGGDPPPPPPPPPPHLFSSRHTPAGVALPAPARPPSACASGRRRLYPSLMSTFLDLPMLPRGAPEGVCQGAACVAPTTAKFTLVSTHPTN